MQCWILLQYGIMKSVSLLMDLEGFWLGEHKTTKRLECY